MPKRYQLDYFEDVTVLKHKHKFFRRLVTFVFLSALAFGVIVSADYVGNFIATGEFVSSIFTQNSNTVQYYAVILSEFDELSAAQAESTSSAESGGAGFVWEDETYKVVANIYKSREDADKVAANLLDSEYTATVYQITYDINSDIKEVFDLLDDVYADLYTISTEVEKGDMSVVVASSEVNKLKSDVHLMQIKYGTMQTSESPIVSELLSNLEDYLESASLQLLCDDNSSYIIRHVMAETVSCGYNIATE